MTDDIESRVPPHDLESEGAILSLCMVDPDAFKRVAPMLRAEDFYSAAHQNIYKACMSVNRTGGIDIVRVAGYLKDNGLISATGGMSYLTEVLNVAPSTSNIVAYAKTVRNKARMRDLIRECQGIVARGYGPHGDDSEFLTKAGTKVREITRVADRSALKSNVQALKEVFLRIQQNQKDKKDVTGLRTGLDDLDRVTTGLHGKQLTIVAARPGGGKSSRLLQIADVVASSGIGVAFFSLEMNTNELSQRHISMRASVDATLLELGQLSKEAWTRVTEEMNQISKLPIMYDETPDLTIHQIRERALGAIDDGFSNKQPIGLICMDYLQRARVPQEDKRKTQAEQIEDVARGLKELAKETCLPVIAAAQLRRIPDGRPNKCPTMDDIRSSGGIENEADVIELLYRPNQYDKKVAVEDAEIIIGKSRHGRDGTIKVTWEPQYTRFSNRKDDYFT